MSENKKAVVFIAEGFEEIEAVTVLDILRRAGIEALAVSITGNIEASGSHGLTLRCDLEFAEASQEIENAEALILPGGPGITNLKNHQELGEALKRADGKGTLLAAVCAAPSVLGALGILKGKNAVCYPGYERELTGANVIAGPFSVSENVITGKAAGTAHEFAFKIVEALVGNSKADEVRSKMFY